MGRTVQTSDMDLGQIGIVRLGNEFHYAIAYFDRARDAKGLAVLSTTPVRIVGGHHTVMLLVGAAIVPVLRMNTLMEDYPDRPGSIALGATAPSLIVHISEMGSGDLNLTTFEMTGAGGGRTYCTFHWDIVAPNSVGEIEVIFEHRPPGDVAAMVG